MTGSLSSLPETQKAHANSPQWMALSEALVSRDRTLRLQPEIWWREQAIELTSKWIKQGLPTTRLEEWKYTSLVGLHARKRTVAESPVDILAPSGVRVLRLSELESDSSISIYEKSQIRSLLKLKTNIYFENLAKSFVVDPFLIFVPNNFHSETPIEISFRGVPMGQWGFAIVALIVGENANASMIESYGSKVDVQTSATFIQLEKNAKLSHLRLQSGDGVLDQGYVLSSAHVRVGEQAQLAAAQVSFGSRLSREDLTVELHGVGADATTDGVFIGRANQLLDHHTNLVHCVGLTTSRQVYKGLLADESRGVFNGRIAIAKHAVGSSAAQMNRNLLLSKKVELDTKPQLEIENDDVKAAHGASIGKLEAEHLFYLQSRGVSMTGAIEMLARGFAYEAVGRLNSETLRKRGSAAIESALTGISWETL